MMTLMTIEKDELAEKANDIHEAVVETDKNQMGFTRTEVIKINNALWQYECAMHAYAKEHGKEAAHAKHKSLQEETRVNVDRAFIMVQRRLAKCIDDAQSS